MEEIIIYTDGGARGNPGPAGAGVVIERNGEVLKEASRYLGTRTNNWAEYEAVIVGFEEAKKLGLKGKPITFKLDSELVTRQLSGSYQIKEPTLFEQFIKIHNFQVKDFPHVTFEHIRREKNKEADRLANEAMDRGK